MEIIENLKQKATFLNRLSNNEETLFEHINSNHDNLDEVIQQYKPERVFKPVNTLRFLIANELKKGTVINATVINQLKQAIEDRDVSVYFNLNESVKQSLLNYKDSKKGMFPNWGHTFKVLFPFLYNEVENTAVIRQLESLADEIIQVNQLENVTKHIVSFQGSQNYGSDHVWVAIIPKASPNVQSAYQIFFNINLKGLSGGIHKGHKLETETDDHIIQDFNTWSDFLDSTKSKIDEWKLLNSKLDFNALNKSKYYLVGAYWKNNSPEDQTERFIREGVWVNGYDEDQFFPVVKEVRMGDHLAIRSVDKRGNNMYIKARGIVTKNQGDGQNLEVEWETNFNAFKLNFTGGYWQTIRKLSKRNHINAIWTNNKIMVNVKQEFIDWYIANPRSSYFNNQPEKIDDYLAKSLESFSKNIFLVSSNTYEEMIVFIEETINNNKPKFLKNHGAVDSGKLAAIIGKRNYQKFLNEYFSGKLEGEVASEIIENYKAPLNQIFYGPPGTGKTYNTILEAAKIIEQDEDLSYTEAQDVFNENLGDKIEFITFHQNYSYEDFIQGLRPDTEISGELSFFKSDGVFKRIADRALKNLKDSENPESAKKEFDKVFYKLIEPLSEGDVEEFEIKMKQTSFYITEVGGKSIEFRKNQGDSKHTLSINTLRKMYDKGVNDIILGGLQPYYNPILNLLLEKGKRDVEPVKKQNYVIIIDEINRANISRVFGELITLIEKDKRSHGKIPLTATLPSGEPFIVPSNLYVIGTMNTADKSIALLDIALRRRFEFKAMYPQYDIEGKIIHESGFLEKLNKLIVDSGKGHDFTIGHSYFMCDDNETFDFDSSINNKVIPLMLEYYMNAEDEVKKILKDAGVTVGNWPLEVLPND